MKKNNRLWTRVCALVLCILCAATMGMSGAGQTFASDRGELKAGIDEKRMAAGDRKTAGAKSDAGEDRKTADAKPDAEEEQMAAGVKPDAGEDRETADVKPDGGGDREVAGEKSDIMKNQNAQENPATADPEENADGDTTAEAENENIPEKTGDREILVGENGQAGEGISTASSGTPLADFLGMDPEIYLNWLESHANDDYYLTTPYRGYDWRSPNGDINSFGAASDGVSAGMNCTGFVWHALYKATVASGGDTSNIPAMPPAIDWPTLYVNYGIEHRVFSTKEEMLTSGYCSKGDIIWMWDGSEANPYGDHHVAIYWGDASNPDLCWHSIDGASDGNGLAYDGNIISRIVAKVPGAQFTVVKTANLPGHAKVAKRSTENEITEENSCYSLAGAVYTAYSDEGCTNPLGELTTDESGQSNELEVPIGTCYVKETCAPAGFFLDETVYPLEAVSTETAYLNVQEKPNSYRPLIIGEKMDAAGIQFEEIGHGTQGGLKDFSGTEFTVKYYDGYYTKETIESAGKPKRSWKFKTDSNGYAGFQKENLISGDALYMMDGHAVLPLGTVVITETKAPLGYRLNPELFVSQITGGPKPEDVTFAQPTIPDEVFRGGVSIEKQDAEMDKAEAQGDGTLKGAVFAIVSENKKPVNVEGKIYKKGETVKKIITDENGIASTAKNLLPYGAYAIQEIDAPEGYLNKGKNISIKFS
ncbi:SpaA isopeptide-forming pilin-related protein [Hespellia stercorisuis]|uniref:Cna protein B-type domain-containing protein n=1 Tax=Hespellia stercorisuis DSM 15480 TaxID=1121950 RepID=A0A1M6R430_9FIRM|nr:SpaA isopeptide-forming pilin-related protein [Hespellia stercorisuis]SHK27088.1 Cna protein B-type domain-containing protein [Hespellia stercorisuis DSM 15480]